ncbi:LysR family transcriptional regulator, mexEF-oprN operon transcriptional activator [Vibrio crassostreae]|uniref:LysR family transcriptional regulator n=1 Tax=Vibrio crassostreae TaxID=246167 RepID=UPI001B302508|nr:LysR family transcriptional regulator [Vibrio crassostreae]CAK2054339.1 LysR family transcriptional regulator, mexEF-oprN operon transcriptional activator [Vibrio crassostreae]CAK2058009.1 LysR family transcriptional regulator, mexEF-oprN operon transcriptional activator [Vibrio crassostreae]CAK2058288.1 LysR family transcriptional regulator, mexEF-oprN operon transcriptional activator [Vibrio crassostreae]CAK2062060.1 LysR family transcriptional regulator, mexEF-oprN operon transcriptional 
MADFNWKGIDLNLLIALQALYKTNSVSKAAERCYVSQSAMSHSLQRLRKLFDDPLFERVGSKMEATDRAIELSSTVDALLNTIQSEVLLSKSFDAETYKGTWKIGLTDYAEQMFAPILFDLIKQSSPYSQVALFNVNRSNYQQVFEDAKLDMTIGSFGEVPKQDRTKHLYTEQHVCLLDQSVLSIEEPISLEQFVAVEHALVSPAGALKTGVDTRLGELGLSRKVAISSSNFLTVKRLIRGRELLCIVPKLVARKDIDSEETLLAVKPPIDVPDFDIQLVYRKAKHLDDKNKRLRKLITNAISSVISE